MKSSYCAHGMNHLALYNFISSLSNTQSTEYEQFNNLILIYKPLLILFINFAALI